MNEIRNNDLIAIIIKTTIILSIIIGAYLVISAQKDSINSLTKRAQIMQDEINKRDTVLLELRTHIAYYEHLHINCHKINAKK